MNRFLEMKERGEPILFSELLSEIPSDDVLYKLFPHPRRSKEQLVTRQRLEVLRLRLDGLRLPAIAVQLGITLSQAARASALIKNSLYENLPSYIDVDIPALRKLLGMGERKRTGYTEFSEQLRVMPPEDSENFLCQIDSRRMLIDENGIIVVEEHTPVLAWEFGPLFDLFYSCGYKFVYDHKAVELALSFVGKNITEFQAELRRRAQKSADARQKRNQSRRDWAEQVDHMSNMVIGIESIDIFETGFHVWLLLNSQCPYPQQRDYIRDRHRDIIRFINKKLQSARRQTWKKAAGLMPFAALISVTLTKQNTVQYTYELKQKIQEVLKDSSKDSKETFP